MTVSIKRFSILLVIAFCLGITANGQSVKPSKDLPNLYKINSNLYRGGQPTEAGIKELSKMGVKTIIDLRDDDDRAQKEDRLVRSAGLRFINIPLSNWFGPKDEMIDGILKQIDQPDNQPVFVHCKRGSDRTGTVIAVYRITHDGWTGEQANAEAKKFGFGWWQFWMKDFINDYYKDFKAKTAKPVTRS
jgi:Protein tyrosine/serine phosphatase